MSRPALDRKDVRAAVKTALHAGEIHSLDLLLLCMDEGLSTEELKRRVNELRDNLSLRKKYFTTFAETKKRKGEGYMSSLRLKWRKELSAYLKANFTPDEVAYANTFSRGRSFKREKDDDRASLRNSQAEERRLLTADTLIMMKRAGIQLACEAIAAKEYMQPTNTPMTQSAFYRTVELPLPRGEDAQHLKNTRMHGTLYTPGAAYAVINLGTGLRSIRTLGEMRYQYLVNTTLQKGEQIDKLIMLGRDTFREADNNEHMRLAVEYLTNTGTAGEGQCKINQVSISGLYREAHFIPETYNGIRQLRLLAYPYYWDRLTVLLGLTADPHSAYDATAGDSRKSKITVCCNLLTGNLNSLSRILSSPSSCVKRIYMFPWQGEFYNTALEALGVHDRTHAMYINPRLLDPVFLDICEIEQALGLAPLESFYRQPIRTEVNKPNG